MLIYLLIGGNLGERENNLEIARNWIAQKIGTIVLASSIYETAAWGVTDQPDFLNQALLVKSEASPVALLDEIQWIETKMGRVRKRHWGERLIDIDILFYGQEIINSERLNIPHPGIPDRKFVLLPMREIAADFVHPVLETTIESLSLACPDLLEVRKK
ncbi:MAG: 2-amino-4-hydroxy-6-hydroxymethyldihydropteridine diphosphokinase [Bacteroidota bacterium]